MLFVFDPIRTNSTCTSICSSRIVREGLPNRRPRSLGRLFLGVRFQESGVAGVQEIQSPRLHTSESLQFGVDPSNKYRVFGLQTHPSTSFNS